MKEIELCESQFPEVLKRFGKDGAWEMARLMCWNEEIKTSYDNMKKKLSDLEQCLKDYTVYTVN